MTTKDRIDSLELKIGEIIKILRSFEPRISSLEKELDE